MKQPDTGAERCMVSGAELLPAGSGGAQSLCRAIEQALAGTAAGTNYRVHVLVVRNDMLSATVTTGNGRQLPELSTSVSDASFTQRMLERFSADLAAHVNRHLENR